MQTCPQCASSCEDTHRFCPSCGGKLFQLARSNADPWIGESLPGGYVIVEHIGDGGMGKVYRAEQSALGRTVAIKIVHSHLLGDETTAARFIMEARAASRLNHPHSLAVVDFGKTAAGQLYLVMEYLRGKDLARVIEEEGFLPVVRIIDILRQLLDALSEAHRLGIVHRDLKPENIIIEPMRTGGDFVKVVDFGLAKILDNAHGPAITAAGIVCGTPDYMAPEQSTGSELDSRSDLYAVGVMLFQLLAGRLPFEGTTPTQILLQHLSAPPPDPRVLAPQRMISNPLAEVTLRALVKDPALRFQTADEFARALMAARDQLEAESVRMSMPPATSARVRCPSCGEPLPEQQKFCGECGNRITAAARSLPHLVDPLRADGRTPPRPPVFPLRLTARAEDLSWIVDRIAQASQGLFACRVVGDSGMGKTRLLDEFEAVTRSEGHLVIRVGPDPWRARVSYRTLQAAVVELAGLPGDGGSQRVWKGASPVASTGLLALFGRLDGNADADVSAAVRRGAVAEALRWAFGVAYENAQRHPLVLIVDDLDHVDFASRNGLGDVLGDAVACPVLVVASHAPGYVPDWPGLFPARILTGLSPESAEELLGGAVPAQLLRERVGQNLAPLYVEQLARFTREGGTTLPRRLGDLLALRVARLETGPRRVLQAIAVLGDLSTTSDLDGMLPADTDVAAAVEQLLAAGLVVPRGEGLRIPHPLLREIAEAAIPAAGRQQLHKVAAQLATAKALPIEVRAHYSLIAEEGFEALLMLDNVGNAALARDDVDGAIDAFERGLAFARSPSGRAALDDAAHATVLFSRKLAVALARAEQYREADTVLREALDHVGGEDIERARLLFTLAKVARSSSRESEASLYISQACEIAQRLGETALVAKYDQLRRSWG